MPTVRSLCMFVRFMDARHIGVGSFYEAVLGLSRIRSFRHAVDWKRQDKDLYWGGECILFETFYNGLAEVSPEDGDPDRAALVPVFRTSNLDALIAQWALRGAAVVRTESTAIGGRQAYVRDPAGLLIAVREVAAPDTPRDREALRRRQRGEAFNPGCLPMAEHLQEIGWVQRRVADVAGLKPFYAGILGLALLGEGAGWAHYDLGDNTTLEVIAGGVARPAPGAQMETTGALIVRVDDVIALRERARTAGYTVVNELYEFPRGKLSYIADGEGNIIGIYHAVHPSAYIASHPPAPEDIEAARRLAETEHVKKASDLHV